MLMLLDAGYDNDDDDDVWTVLNDQIATSNDQLETLIIVKLTKQLKGKSTISHMYANGSFANREVCGDTDCTTGK